MGLDRIDDPSSDNCSDASSCVSSEEPEPSSPGGTESQDDYSEGSSEYEASTPKNTPIHSPKTRKRGRTKGRGRARKASTTHRGPGKLLPSAKRLECHVCGHVQKQKRPREKDLERHMETVHQEYRPERMHLQEIRCVGVPKGDPRGQAYLRKNPNTNTIRVWKGMTMVGGCNTDLSRIDSLQRHLQRKKGQCIGDVEAYKKALE
jgi:hypothetical protein